MKKDNEKISIIVPVYNVEKYLKKCINSLINQTYENIEILLVDDGSTDSCGKICDEYSLIDNRIRVFHKTNGGQGSARNLALNNITGEYICFVDSDDYVKLDYIEYLYKLLKEKELDIAICNYEIYSENGKLVRKRNNGEGYREFSNIEAINSMWYQEIVNIGPWVKLYRRELWNKVRFEECYSEDYATMHKIFIKARKIGYSYETKLMYLIRTNSSINSFKKEKVIMLDIALNTIEFSQKYLELESAAYHKAISVYFHILFQLPNNREYKEIKRKIICFIKNNRRKVFSDKRCSKKVKYAIILSYFGFNFTQKLFGYIKHSNISF